MTAVVSLQKSIRSAVLTRVSHTMPKEIPVLSSCQAVKSLIYNLTCSLSVLTLCSCNPGARGGAGENGSTSTATTTMEPTNTVTKTSHSEEQRVRRPLPSVEVRAALPPDGGAEFNRLIHETSPYLLQHARNPVAWYPWGEEAFAKAKAENKIIFLSVGYSSCHWCHVMEHESFEKQEVADVLNRDFVAIKLDREERPDLDEIYMKATHALRKRGGWPNSVWLTPDGRPWFAGTYFPKDQFINILQQLQRSWDNEPGKVEQHANQLAQFIKSNTNVDLGVAEEPPTYALLDNAEVTFRGEFDAKLGGFGPAPKFPPHGTLRVLLHQYRRLEQAGTLEMITKTLDEMARGGIHDHIGGGFHRYSTDERWFLPHFEKMLYDNAQLSRIYTEAYVITGNPSYREVAVGIFEWVLRDMTGNEGGFYSALDADSEGEEGKYYLWTQEEVLNVLGDEAGALFCRVYNIKKVGNYYEESTGERHQTSIAHLSAGLDEHADRENIPLEELRQQLAASRNKLQKVRANRVWPFLDDKVITSWNGLMIESFAYAGKHLENPIYLKAAEQAAEFILTSMRKGDRLLRTYREGEAKLNAYLEDYAFLASGLLELYAATDDPRWLHGAETLVNTLKTHYYDKENGGFFFTSDDHENLLARSKDPFDAAIPSGNAMATRVLASLAGTTGEEVYGELLQQCFRIFIPFAERSPQGGATILLAVAAHLERTPAESTRAAVRETPAGDSPGSPKKAVADAQSHVEPVTVEAFLANTQGAPGGVVQLALRLTINDNWHINSKNPNLDYLIPAALKIKPNSAVTLGAATFPEPKEFRIDAFPTPIFVYEGQILISMPLNIANDALPGNVSLDFIFTSQACDDKSCQPPQDQPITLKLKITPDARAGITRHQEVFDGLKH